METSETTDKIIPALIKAQKSITNPELKSSVDYDNKRGGKIKFRYADLAACLAAVKKPLLDNDVTLFQDFARNDGGIAVTTTLYHASGEWVASSPLPMPVNAADPQGVGSAFTYGKRYTLTALLGIVGEDQPPEPDQIVVDDDAKKAQESPAPKKSIPAKRYEAICKAFLDVSDIDGLASVWSGMLTADERKSEQVQKLKDSRKAELEVSA